MFIEEDSRVLRELGGVCVCVWDVCVCVVQVNGIGNTTAFLEGDWQVVEKGDEAAFEGF